MASTFSSRLVETISAMRVLRIVDAVATTNITLSGLQTVGGIALQVDSVVLVTAQTNPVLNGVYIARLGLWTRDGEFNFATTTDGFVLVRNPINGLFQFWLYTAPPPPRSTAINAPKIFTFFQLFSNELAQAQGYVTQAQTAANNAGTSATAAAQSATDTATLLANTQPRLYQPGDIVTSFAATRSGALLCNGTTFSQTTYPNLYAALGNSNVLPDLRGEFLRGFDNGRGVDSGRVFRSSQTDAFQGHWHQQYGTPNQGQNAGTADRVQDGGTLLSNTAVRNALSDGVNGTPRVAAETRPRNVAVNYFIIY